jgi:hypothetical protein
MDFEQLTYNIKQQSSIGLPIICFSITKNVLHITTKKGGSRFFEHLDDTTKYIEFKVKSKVNCTEYEINNGIEFYDYIFLYFESNSILTTNEFFKILGIENIVEITKQSFSNNWEVVIVTRDPIIRLLSGYVELVDSMLATYTSIKDLNIFSIIEAHTNKCELLGNPFVGLKGFSIEESNKILNYFSNKIEETLISDEHTSNWNSFIFYFLSKYKSKFIIVDIDNNTDMSNYGNLGTCISNKNIYLNWLNGESNQLYINKLFTKLNYFLVTEYTNYLNVISLK